MRRRTGRLFGTIRKAKLFTSARMASLWIIGLAVKTAEWRTRPIMRIKEDNVMFTAAAMAS